jgi:hypothetical protein
MLIFFRAAKRVALHPRASNARLAKLPAIRKICTGRCAAGNDLEDAFA